MENYFFTSISNLRVNDNEQNDLKVLCEMFQKLYKFVIE